MAASSEFEEVAGDWLPHATRYLEILRSPRWRLIVALHDALHFASTSFWRARGARVVHLPITTGSISSPMGLGSDSQPVSVELAGERTFLADSMQFMLEYACRLSERGAWYVMPSFRGEATDSTHLQQFFHSEAEIPGGLDEVIDVVGAYVRAITSAALDAIDSTADVQIDVSHLESFLASSEIPRLTFDEACGFLGDDDDRSIAWVQGQRILTRVGERRLMAEFSPVLWVTHHDRLSVPFYQAQDGSNPRSALCADLLFGIGEVVGAGERHANGDEVRAALADHGVGAEPYEWYVRLKDEFPMRTSGFGLGVERWLQWVLAAPDIRDLQVVPRVNGVSLLP